MRNSDTFGIENQRTSLTLTNPVINRIILQTHITKYKYNYIPKKLDY
jgi:hypothetical protein